jgi:Domain of unknown function (DUF4111)
MNEALYLQELEGYPDVVAAIRALQGGIPRVLGDTLVGLYLTGSLSYGGFDPASSDIDFLALCRQRPRADEIAALSAMHRDIAHQTPDWAERIEGSYIWESLLSSLEPPSEPRPYINGGALWAPEPRYGQEWTMNLFVLHERGVALFGLPAAEVFPPVSMQSLRQASLRSLHDEWEPLLVNDAPLDDPHYQAYLTLTRCRILHTQQVDGVASKRDAAHWVKATYGAVNGETIRHTVERAEQWEVGQPLDMKREVLDLLRFTLAETGRSATD